MKFDIPLMAWHYDLETNNSLDFHPFNDTLAVCGSDSSGQSNFWWVWEISKPNLLHYFDIKDKCKNNDLQELLQNTFKWKYQVQSGHTKIINIVRHSNDGNLLATGGDDFQIFIWNIKLMPIDFGQKEEILKWGIKFNLHGHNKEIFDLCWSKDDSMLFSSSLDNSILVWSAIKGRLLYRLDGHSSYVKSISIDPLNEYLISQGDDKCLKIWKKQLKKNNFYLKSSIKNIRIKQVDNEEDILIKLFKDPNWVECLYKRIDWSPDGNLFCSVSGIFEDKNKSINCCHIFSKLNFNYPTIILPIENGDVIVSKFNPYLFKYNNIKNRLFDINYTMFLLVCSKNSIYIYNIQLKKPIYVVLNCHYGSISDASWKDPYTLAISSFDGYISFLTFNENDFGEILEKEDIPDNLKNIFSCKKEYKTIDVNSEQVIEKDNVIKLTEQKNFKREDGKKIIIPKKVIK